MSWVFGSHPSPPRMDPVAEAAVDLQRRMATVASGYTHVQQVTAVCYMPDWKHADPTADPECAPYPSTGKTLCWDQTSELHHAQAVIIQELHANQ